jgi:hypothetical protein
MADAGLFIGWGAPVRGREKRALEVFGDDQAFWARMQQDGRIESYETVILEPHGGDLAGFILVRGTSGQLDDLTADEDFRRRRARAGLIVEGLGTVQATLGDGLQQLMSIYQQAVDEWT